MTEQEYLDQARNLIRGYIPESNAWRHPSILDVIAKTMAALGWQAYNEAKNGIDSRAIIATATGDDLDNLVSMPPINTTRRGETYATGYVSVNLGARTFVAAGELFSVGARSYIVTCYTKIISGVGIVPVKAQTIGTAGNSPFGEPMMHPDGTATSRGISGGWGIETDEELRTRVYAENVMARFGSLTGIEATIEASPDVYDAYACDGCGGKTSLWVIMTDRLPPDTGEIQRIEQYMNDRGRRPAYSCIDILPASPKQLKITAASGCNVDIITAVNKWIIAGAKINQDFTVADVEMAIRREYPEASFSIISVDGIASNGEIFTSAVLV